MPAMIEKPQINKNCDTDVETVFETKGKSFDFGKKFFFKKGKKWIPFVSKVG